MRPASSKASQNGEPHFAELPPEILTIVFCQLCSLTDALALAAACHRLRGFWLDNVDYIYNSVGRRVIPCEAAARRFLLEQDRRSLHSSLTSKDVVEIVHNARVVESAAVQFEREIVSRVRTDGISVEEFYGAGLHKRPPTLTRSERVRFVSSYYQLWHLMRLEPHAWSPILGTMTCQELYYLWEMSKLTQSIGQEETVPAPPFPDEPPDSIHSINNGRSDHRDQLERSIWGTIEYKIRHFVGRDATDPSVFAKHEGFHGFVVMWDHSQPLLKEMVCCKPGDDVDLVIVKQHLWRDY